MSHNQLETTLRSLDDDGIGGIDVNEVLKWLNGEEMDMEAGGDEETGGMPVGQQTPMDQIK